jgi:hypothetical protein
MSAARPALVSYFSESSPVSGHLIRIVFLLTLLTGVLGMPPVLWASDWEEDSPAKKDKTGAGQKSRPKTQEESPALSGRVEKEGVAPLRLERPNAVPENLLKSLSPQLDPPAAKLQGAARDGLALPRTPQSDTGHDLLQGKVELLGGKSAKTRDPDEDDAELMVEWDNWHNRFLRAVQLATQEIVNNPDPEDFERPRLDPRSGNLTSRYPLGIGCVFSCVVTNDKQIKNPEITEPSGYARYDRAVLRAVQQLSGTQILNFPKGSHRLSVVQPGRIKTGNSSEFRYYHFGDIERIRHPASPLPNH